MALDPMKDLAREQAEDRAIELTPAADLPAWPPNVTVGERPSEPTDPPVGRPTCAPRPPDRPVCPDCGTPHIGAAGPHGAVLVPGCWCADDKRKAAR